MIDLLKIKMGFKAKENIMETEERNRGLKTRIPIYQPHIEFFLLSDSNKSVKAKIHQTPTDSIQVYFSGPNLDIENLWGLTKGNFEGYREMIDEDFIGPKDKYPEIPLYRLRRLISKDFFHSSSMKRNGEDPFLGKTLLEFNVPGRNSWTGKLEDCYGYSAELLNDNFHYQKWGFKDPIHIRANWFDFSFSGGTTKKDEAPFYLKKQNVDDGWNAHTIVRNDEEDERVAPMFARLIEEYFSGEGIKSLSVYAITSDEVITLNEAKSHNGFQKIKTFESIIMGHLPLSKITKETLKKEDLEDLPYGTQHYYGFYWKNNSQGLLKDRTNSGYIVKNLFTAVKNYKEPVDFKMAMRDIEILRVM